MNPGDILWSSRFPSSEGRGMPHPAVVVSARRDVTGNELVYALLGTSRHIPASGRRPSELIVRTNDGKDFWATGLKKDTLFDFVRGTLFRVTEDMRAQTIGRVQGKPERRMARAYIEWRQRRRT